MQVGQEEEEEVVEGKEGGEGEGGTDSTATVGGSHIVGEGEEEEEEEGEGEGEEAGTDSTATVEDSSSITTPSIVCFAVQVTIIMLLQEATFQTQII